LIERGTKNPDNLHKIRKCKKSGSGKPGKVSFGKKLGKVDPLMYCLFIVENPD
jgi:hypothetical protein